MSATVVDAQKSGKSVVRMENVTKGFDGRTIVDDFSIKINRGERIGVIGPNGSGKTTLLKLIMGKLEADTGRIDLGTNLEPLVIDQKRESLNPEWTLKEALTDGGSDTVMVGGHPLHVVRYMKDFLFAPEQQRTPLHVLSGGERGRLQLARGLRHPSNLLVLDEPTNDLDLETLDLLQELVADYNGTVLIVSHDRDFLDRTVTRAVGYEGDGQWQVYAGGYSDMVAQRGEGVTARRALDSSGSGKATAKKNANKNTPPDAQASAPKLSYKHKFRLEQLPKEIAGAEARIADMTEKMSDPDYFTRDPDGFMATSEALAEIQDKLDTLELEWLELSEMQAGAAS